MLSSTQLGNPVNGSLYNKNINSPSSPATAAAAAREKQDDTATISTTDAARHKVRLPFACIITCEVLFVCLAISAALMAVSVTGQNSGNNLCLNQGASDIQDLAIQIQTRVSLSLVRSVADITNAPVDLLSQTAKLYKQTLVNINNYDQMFTYFYNQIIDAGTSISAIYYGTEDRGDMIGIAKANYAPPYSYTALLGDSGQLSTPPASRCPQICPQNMTVGPNHLYLYNVDSNGRVSDVNPLVVLNFTAKSRPWYSLAAKLPVNAVETWTPVYVFGNNIDIGVTLSRPLLDAGGALNAALAVDLDFSSINAGLKTLSLTPNGFILLFNSDGVLFGTSIATENVTKTITDDTTGKPTVSTKNITELTDPNSLLAITSVLDSVAGNLSNLPANMTYQRSGLIFQHLLFSDSRGLNLIVVNGAPLTDYTNNIEVTRATLADRLSVNVKIMIAIAVAVSATFILASIPFTWALVGRPMARLARNMEEVSRFDFSSLHGVDRKMRSRIRELATIESAYWGMITKFAHGISENRRLLQGKSGAGLTSRSNVLSTTSSQQQQQQVMSGNNAY